MELANILARRGRPCGLRSSQSLPVSKTYLCRSLKPPPRPRIVPLTTRLELNARRIRGGFQNWNIETCQPPSPACYCFCLGWYPPSSMPATLEVYINSPLPTSFSSLVLHPVACPFLLFLSSALNALFAHPPLPSRLRSFRATVIHSRRSRT